MRRGFLGIAVLAVGLTACSAQDVAVERPSASSHPATSASPSPTGFAATASAEQRAAADAALKSYRAYMDAVVAARANPARVPDGLKRYSTDQALADELSWLLTLEKQRVEFRGKPKLNPTVVDVDLETGTVVAVDCQLSSKWLPVDAETGESRLAPGQSDSLRIDVTVRNYAGRWMVTRAVTDRSRPC